MSWDERAVPAAAARWAGDAPGRRAVVHLRTGRTLTYRDLWTLADRYAGAFRAAGAERAPVALIFEDACEYAAAMLGAERAGAVWIALAPDLRADELTALLRFVEVRVVAGDVPPQVVAQVPSCAAALTVGGAPQVLRGALPPLTYEVQPEWVRFRPTSGTQARPKIVIISAGAEAARAARRYRPLAAGEVLVSSYGVANDSYLRTVLEAGGTYINAAGRDPDGIARAVAAERAAVVAAIPWVFRQWAASPAAQASVRGTRVGLRNGAMPVSAVRTLHERAGLLVANHYGSSEAGAPMQPHTAWVEGKMDSIGRPHPGVDVRLVAHGGAEAASDEPGELWVRGPGLMVGYLKDPGRTAEAFADGWFHTGDLMSRDAEGYYRLVGRVKAMINVAGRKVHPEEVETVLLEHPAVVQAVVMAGPDPLRGERVEALVIPASGGLVSSADLRAFCRRRLAPYKVPRQVTFVDALPMTRTGRVARHPIASLTEG